MSTEDETAHAESTAWCSIPIHVPEQAEPVGWADGGPCDSIDLGYGLIPVTRLRAQAMADSLKRAAGWQPEQPFALDDPCMRCGMPEPHPLEHPLTRIGPGTGLCCNCDALRFLPVPEQQPREPAAFRRDRLRWLRVAALLYLIAAAVVSVDMRPLAWVAPATLIGCALALACSWDRP